MATGMVDPESLFIEVNQVQQRLENFSVCDVDANKIFELLEKNSHRSDRVEYVLEYVLKSRGLNSYMVDISEDSFDDFTDDWLSSSENEPELPELSALDLSFSNFQNVADPPIDGIETGNSNNSSNNPSTSSSVPKAKHPAEESSGPRAEAPEIETPYRNDDFLCDVNNNDPNNNIECEAPMEMTNDKETRIFSDPDDIDVEFEDQEDIRCKLLEEARLIHQVVPKQNLEQIYSYLEANLDRKNRLQIVMQEFLKMELASGGCAAPQSDCGSVNKPEENKAIKQNNSVIEQASSLTTLVESQPSTSDNNFSLLKTLNEIRPSKETEPCTSADVKMDVCRRNDTVGGEQISVKIVNDSVDPGNVSNVLVKIKQNMKQKKNKILEYHQLDGDIKRLSAHTRLANQRIKDGDSRSTRHDPVNVPDLNVLPTQEFQEMPLPSTSKGNSDLKMQGSDIKQKRKLDVPCDILPEKKNKTNETTPTENLVQELTEEQCRYKSSLMEIFPDVDAEYLNEQCRSIGDELGLNNLISNMLQNGYPHSEVQEAAPDPEPQPGPSVSVPLKEKIEAQYKTLLAILPNADPTYLYEHCELMNGNEELMKDFVSDALENRNYPTKEEYLKRQEAMAHQKKYTEQFSVKEFLDIFPDPFKYFHKEKKSDNTILSYALPYLKRRYKKLRQHDILVVLKNCNYNLSKACEGLDTFAGRGRKSKRSGYECKIPPGINIPFLQEVAFIENKEKIKNYINENKKRKKKAFKLAKAKGELLECACCYNDELMTEDVATCNEGHLFCKECIRKFAEIKIGNGETSFPCLNDCGSEFSLKTLQVILKPSIFSKMLQRKQLEEVKAAGIEDLETCPFCDFASIPPKEDKVFRCLNPECMRESCRSCKEPSHIPLRCNEVENSDEVKARTFIENRMTEALVRTCWSCKKKFIKEDGCNKMTCTCGALMCYVCRQPVADYTHFNGQGGDSYEKCPLYSNNEIIHVNPVREEAQKAKEELKALNPNLNLKHDPTKNLPVGIPQNNPVPHAMQFGNLGFNPRFNRRPEPVIGVRVFAEVMDRYRIIPLQHYHRNRAYVQIQPMQAQNLVVNPDNVQGVVHAVQHVPVIQLPRIRVEPNVGQGVPGPEHRQVEPEHRRVEVEHAHEFRRPV